MSLGRSGHTESPEIAQRLAIYDDPAAAHRAMLALDAGKMGSWRLDILTDMVTGDQVFADFFQLDPQQQPWPSSMVFGPIAKDDLPHVQARFDKALQGAAFYEAEFRTIFPPPPGGLVKWIGGRGTVTERSDDGGASVMIGVNWDATLQKQHEERLAMVASEMDHRIKNAYAVI